MEDATAGIHRDLGEAGSGALEPYRASGGVGNEHVGGGCTAVELDGVYGGCFAGAFGDEAEAEVDGEAVVGDAAGADGVETYAYAGGIEAYICISSSHEYIAEFDNNMNE